MHRPVAAAFAIFARAVDGIDRDWCNSTGSPRGPFEIMDMIGMRSIVNVTEGSGEDQPEWKKKFTEIAKQMIEEGRSGQGDGEGFYKYDDNGNKIEK